MKEEPGQMVVKNGYYLVILDVRHRHTTGEILHKTGEQPWITDQLSMHLIIRLGGASMNQVKAITLNKVCNTWYATVRKNSSFVNIMKRF